MGNKLIPTLYGNKIIMTTNQVAEYYNVEPKIIKQNFNNNKKQFRPNKDYFLLKGNELKAFKNEVENFDLVGKNASQLYLWTEFGVLLHAKSINTQEAWDKYFVLVDNYFRVAQNHEPKVKMLTYLDTPCTTTKEIMNTYRCSNVTVLRCKKGLRVGEEYDYLMGEDLNLFIGENRLPKNMSHLYIFYPKGLKKIERYLKNLGLEPLETPRKLLMITE